jgi:hypothetical protein
MFFLFCNKIALKHKSIEQPFKEGKTQKVVQDHYNKMEENKRGEDGNAARVLEDSCRGPECHMMGVEVRTSVNLLFLPLRKVREKS